MELQRLNEQLEETKAKRGEIARRGLNTQEVDTTIKGIEQQIAENTQNQHLEEHVQANGYEFDKLKTSDGRAMIELSYSPDNHELQAIAVQRKILTLEENYQNALKWFEEKNYELGESNSDLTSKLKNATNIIMELEQEIKAQAVTISGLLEKQAGVSSEIAPLSAEDREKALLAELNGKLTKIYNVHPADPNDFGKRKFKANNAITTEEFEDFVIYDKRYEEITVAAAEQLRVDYATKKAEIEAQSYIPEIPAVEELPAHIEQVTQFPEEDLRLAAFGGPEEAIGNATADTVVEQPEIQVITLESLHARITALEEKAA